MIVVTPGYHMASLDAKTGKPDPAFGKNGVVDLEEGLGYPLVPLAVDDSGSLIVSEAAPLRKAKPGEKWDAATKTGADGTIGIDPSNGQIAASSPAIIVGNVIVVGNSSMHGYYPLRLHNIPGFVRGFDIKTGKQLWKFNLIPQPGEFGAETWKNGSKIGTDGVGKNDPWATYSADPDLGIVYIPVGMPLSDEYGGHRPGDNLYGNSIVAIDAKTGARKWHFQMVHHDIWDYDTPMAPNLLDVTIDGQPRKIIASTTKQGWVYVLDRVTGKPIWPMPETPVLQSDVPGEQTSPTQPIPSKPARYALQGLQESDLIDYTPAIKDTALKLAKHCRMGPYFIPASPADGKGKNGRVAVRVLLVRAGRRRRREHRRWHGGRSGNGDDLRRRTDRPEHDRSDEGSLLRASLQPAAQQLRTDRRIAHSAGRRRRSHPRPWWIRRELADDNRWGARRRRRFDRQAAGARRHHRLRSQDRRQEVVGAERESLA